MIRRLTMPPESRGTNWYSSTRVVSSAWDMNRRVENPWLSTSSPLGLSWTTPLFVPRHRHWIRRARLLH
jgi:hypothetical protein